ncbi:MAG: hypothetical protein DRJ62_01005 [Thermoprotei archaeon]|nr:MAG: hypothetical protein DRJ62_01005 [Thermoprotei archaeon]
MNGSKYTIAVLAILLIAVTAFLFMSMRQPERIETNITPPFSVGEKLLYDIKYENSSGSYFLYQLNLSVIDEEVVMGRECFVLRGEYIVSGNSNNSLVFYSYVTTDNLTLMKTVITSTSGNATLLFDHMNGKCTIMAYTEEGVKTQELDITPDVQDSLSVLYYLRGLPLTTEYWCTFHQITGSGLELIKVEVSEDLKEVDVEAGGFTCYELTLSVGRGSMYIYISNTPAKLPVQVKIPVENGNYSWDLKSYTLS